MFDGEHFSSGEDIMKAPADVAGQPLSGSPRTTGLVSEKVAVSVVFVAAMFMSIMDVLVPSSEHDITAGHGGSMGLRRQTADSPAVHPAEPCPHVEVFRRCGSP